MFRNTFACISGAFVVAIVAIGCDQTPEGPPTRPPAHIVVRAKATDPWVITTADPLDPTPALLWNGLIGLRLGRDSTTNGQPFFSIDEYDTTGEEKIRVLSCPLPNGFLVGGKSLPISSDYTQTLDMRTAEIDTKWKSGNLGVECITVMHPTKKIIAQRWSLTGLPDGETFDFDLGKYGKMRGSNLVASSVVIGQPGMAGKFMAYKPTPAKAVIEYVIALGKSLNTAKIQVARGQIFKPTPGWELPPPLEEFPKIDAETKQIWAERWNTDIDIDGPMEDRQAVHSFLFYLRSAIDPESKMSVSPCGLSNSTYNGHVFWDADMWVFPALMLIDPNEAQAIPAYRKDTEQTAKKNYLEWIQKNRPTAKGFLGPGEPWKSDWLGLKYAWESSASGRETTPEESQFEDHISADVWFMFNQARGLGLDLDETMYIARGAAKFYCNRIAKDPDGTYSLRQTMSPDEQHIGDNDLYTNIVAQYTIDDALWKAPPGQRQILKLPHDSQSLLTYDGDKVRSYKQASAVLSIYPLQYPQAEKQAAVMMSRFEHKVVPDGPAMSASVHSLIWARLGEKDKAYETWKKSWEPFTNHSLMLFSEKAVKSVTYFTTGAAGSLQTVLFGFLGFRLDSEKEPGSAWSTQLQGGTWLSAKPNFPREWKSVKFRNFVVLGRKYTLTATHRPDGADALTVTQGE